MILHANGLSKDVINLAAVGANIADCFEDFAFIAELR